MGRVRVPSRPCPVFLETERKERGTVTRTKTKKPRQAKPANAGTTKAAPAGQEARSGADAAPAQDEAAGQAAHERHVMEVWERCLATKDFKPYLDMAKAIHPSRPDKPAIASAAKAEPATPAKPAVVHQPSEDSAQSPFAREMDYWRAFYGKGGHGEVLVQAGLFLDPDGKLVPAKSLPEPKTPRARLMQVVRSRAEFAIEVYRPGPKKAAGRLLVGILDVLVEGLAEMEAEEAEKKVKTEEQRAEWEMKGGRRGAKLTALAGVGRKPNLRKHRSAFSPRWEERIYKVWRDHEAKVKRGRPATKPSADPKFMRRLLADALRTVGIEKPFEWIKGLPADNRAQVSVLGDFRVERCGWDETKVTLKADLHAEYWEWFKAAKTAHPERYGTIEPLKFNAFARAFNSSWGTREARTTHKQDVKKDRKDTWKGIHILPPSKECAGDKAIRVEAETRKTLLQALAVPPKRT